MTNVNNIFEFEFEFADADDSMGRSSMLVTGN